MCVVYFCFLKYPFFPWIFLFLFFYFFHPRNYFFLLTEISCLLKNFFAFLYFLCSIFCGIFFLWNQLCFFFPGKNLSLLSLFLFFGHGISALINSVSPLSMHSRVGSVFLYSTLYSALYISRQIPFAFHCYLIPTHSLTAVIGNFLSPFSVWLHASSI